MMLALQESSDPDFQFQEGGFRKSGTNAVLGPGRWHVASNNILAKYIYDQAHIFAITGIT